MEKSFPNRSSLRQRIRKNFLTGLVAILPVLLTIYLSWLLFLWSGRFLGELLIYIPYGRELPHLARIFLGFLLLLIIIYLVGVLASHLLGKKLLGLWEKVLSHTPFIGLVYNTSRQFTETFFSSRYAFRQVVAVEYPRPGTYALGFLTSEQTWRLGPDCLGLAVYLPNTPNPTGGRVMIVPLARLYRVNLTVEEAIKLLVSGGMIAPKQLELLESLDRGHEGTDRALDKKERS